MGRSSLTETQNSLTAAWASGSYPRLLLGQLAGRGRLLPGRAVRGAVEAGFSALPLVKHQGKANGDGNDQGHHQGGDAGMAAHLPVRRRLATGASADRLVGQVTLQSWANSRR